MPRPPSNVDEFRNEITASYESGASVPTILDSIAKKGCNCTQRTLERRIASWNLNNRKGRARSDQILSRVQFLFFVRGCQDRSIQTDLKKAGISISLRTIKGIRLRNGMKRPKGRYQYDGNVLSDDTSQPTIGQHSTDATMEQISLNYEASAGDTHKQTVSELPPEVVQCLENARFLHLATCVDNQPHVSLMNYTYLPSSPYSTVPVIVMTTNPASKKTNNLLVNPNVSLLVHDWVSHRPPTQGRRASGGSPGPEHRSSLASMLINLNTSAMSSISATINGTAKLISPGSDEERYYRDQHLENNTFDSEGTFTFNRQPQNDLEDGGRECFVAGEEVQVILVHIKDIRTSDWKGGVRDYVLTAEDNGPIVNGAR